jgi:hypothetical protein
LPQLVPWKVSLPRSARNVLVAMATLLVASAFAGSARAEGLAWAGSFETGDFSQWAFSGGTYMHALPGRVTVVTDPVNEGNYAARFELHAGEKLNPNWSGELAQILTWTNEGAGQEWYWSWDVMFDPTWPTTNGWCVFAEWHQTGAPGVPQGPAPINFECKDDAFRLIVRGGDEPNWVQNIIPIPGFERGVWHHFVFHVKWSPDPDGFVEVWRNGENVIPLTNMRTMYRNQGLYPKFGIYRKNDVNPDVGVLYLDDVRRSATVEGLTDPVTPPTEAVPAATFPEAPKGVAKRGLRVKARTVPNSQVTLIVRDRLGRLVGMSYTTANAWGNVRKRVHLNLRWRGQRTLSVTAVVTVDKRYRAVLPVRLATWDRRVLRLGWRA